ncbi:hypothetical protein Sjap_005181 [Stephania japonica]|uniref:FAR1 domain-containing protein n=1 Tax=Stephania japonica TaxID=461633 RepID=A0AAP0K538_9MAGN
MVIILKSNSSGIGQCRRARFSIGCERYWTFEVKVAKSKRVLKEIDDKDSEDIKKVAGTKKCGCWFNINVKHELDDLWHVRVLCGMHNHRFNNSLVGHVVVGRLTVPEKYIVRDLRKTSAWPKDILSHIKR